MRRFLALLGLAAVALTAPASAGSWSLALHGGAGVIERGQFAPGEEESIRAALNQALAAGEAILAGGGTAVDAVAATVEVLEASPHFNAGVGAVFTSAGTIELDAAIMDGATRRAGAVTGVMTTRSPVQLARALMDTGPWVFLAGRPTDEWARANGLPQVPNSYFMTEARRKQLDIVLSDKTAAGFDSRLRFGTVGAVALDQAGNLAAATSTGGLTGKAPGRVGDAPVIGGGTLAENGVCAVSATGSGEIFMRARAAGAICDRIRWAHETPQAAAEIVIADIGKLGGDGGVIVVSSGGEVAFAMNSSGMYRAAITSAGGRQVKIFADE
jgi:beta-aspartyl-peptidase (threonine type)